MRLFDSLLESHLVSVCVLFIVFQLSIFCVCFDIGLFLMFFFLYFMEVGIVREFSDNKTLLSENFFLHPLC